MVQMSEHGWLGVAHKPSCIQYIVFAQMFICMAEDSTTLAFYLLWGMFSLEKV